MGHYPNESTIIILIRNADYKGRTNLLGHPEIHLPDFPSLRHPW
jgi:hypothetical protein